MTILEFKNEENFEYDIRGLLMAFYPGEEIMTVKDGGSVLETADRQLCVMLTKESAEIVLNTRKGAGIRRTFSIQGQPTAQIKSLLKKNLYEILHEDSDKLLPWGTLTGIRPVKIPMNMLENGLSDAEIKKRLKEEYYISDHKAELSIEIARREKNILETLDYENGYSLYIGIPFCPTTCLYCSFTSYPVNQWKARIDDYLAALFKELDFVKRRFADKTLNTIYIGGGTPTTLTAEQMDCLLDRVEECLDLSGLKEFTVEAGRPDSIAADKLRAIHNHRVSRISINPQTMKQETLNLIGRHHTVEDIIRSFYSAREMGFDNINMDLILGLPGEDACDIEQTMLEIAGLKPDNVTVHSLALKRAARLNIEKDKYQDFKITNTEEMMNTVCSYCGEMGLYPYYLYRQKNMAGNLENVGYAAHGKAGIYNILIMEEKQSIVALGAGSVSKAVFPGGQITRSQNVKDIGHYLERVDEMIEKKQQLYMNA